MRTSYLCYLVLLISFAWHSSCKAQITLEKKSSTIISTEVNPVYLEYDSFGFLYKIENNVLIKTKGSKKFEYKNIQLGEITKVDIINPLKVLIFYQGFNSIVLLDNQFNEVKAINFSRNETPIDASKTGMAAQNQLWIFNTLNSQIVLVDYLNDEHKAISNPITEEMKHYQTDFNYFYWVNPNNNLFSCDLFGKIQQLGCLPQFDQIYFINNNQYLYSNKNRLFFRDIRKLDSNATEEIVLSEKTFKNFYYKDQILSIFTAERITNYKIILP